MIMESRYSTIGLLGFRFERSVVIIFFFVVAILMISSMSSIITVFGIDMDIVAIESASDDGPRRRQRWEKVKLTFKLTL